MKFLIVFVALFAVAMADNILKQDSDVQPDGYKFDFATDDGTRHTAQAKLDNIGTDHESLSVQGSYSFIGDDKQEYTVNYIADENGFQPQGAHLPVAPV